MTSYLLDCFVLTDRHTAAHRASELTRVTNEWGVGDKNFACVTDNAAPRDFLHWDKLKATQKQMGQEQLRLKQDLAAWWNSTFYMLKRFIEIKEPIISILTLTNHQPCRQRNGKLPEKSWILFIHLRRSPPKSVFFFFLNINIHIKSTF